ncbi:MFS transporter [Catellatospora bangladeshensis]|uniref:Putative drug antiporter protein n=1 Tax=Catellatospora bangladeshensis TaxID=310355 RepID=A0A8J3JK93_9ACTN|nr:MFS transporter [Catellatospora bangladeshensis]GIF78699.1 putative drug antiporter protein precursor [Catellatospora bangladeshensis]
MSVATPKSPWRRRAAIPGLVAAEAISVIGGRMSFLAIPWLVLVTTGSPVKVGVVAGAETLAYVLSGVLAAPLQDRIGSRTTSIVSDGASAVVMGAIALTGQLGFGVLIVLSMLAGVLRAQADRSKNNLLKPLMDEAKTDFGRVAAAREGVLRTSGLIGASVGGVAIAAFGAVGAIWVDALTFLAAAVLVVFFIPDPASRKEGGAGAAAPHEPYLTALRGGFTYFRNEPLLRAVTGMLFFTNLFNQASAVVFVPMWVLTVLHSPVALGSVAAAYAIGMIVGSVVFATLAPYLPRYSALVFGYFVGGAPRFLIFAISDDLTVIVIVTFLSGMVMCSVNPTVGAVIYQRVPGPMLARAGGIITAVAMAGIPLGGVLAGLVVERLGLVNGVLLASLLYFAVTLTPVIRHRVWRELNDAGARAPAADRTAPLPKGYGLGAAALGPRVTLRYADGGWTVHARQGLRTLARRRPVAPKAALHALTRIEVPAVHTAVSELVSRDRDTTRLEAARKRTELARMEYVMSDINAGLRAPHLP